MPSDDVAALVRASLDVERWLTQDLGWTLRGRGAERSARCPFHEDSNPSLSINVETGLYFCHNPACGARGDVFDLWRNANGGTFPDALRAFASMLGIRLPGTRHHNGNGSEPRPPDPERERAILERYAPPEPQREREIDPDIAQGFHENLNDEQRQWLRDVRGLSDETIERYQIGHNGHRYTIPVYDEGGTLRNIRQYLPGAASAKMISWREGFGAPRLYPLHIPHDGPLMVCAGEWDALVARQMGFQAFTNTAGEGTWEEAWSQRFSGQDVTLAFDYDPAGEAATGLVGGMLARAGATVRVVGWGAWPHANEPAPLRGYDLTDAALAGAQQADIEGLAQAFPVAPPEPVNAPPAQEEPGDAPEAPQPGNGAERASVAEDGPPDDPGAEGDGGDYGPHGHDRFTDRGNARRVVEMYGDVLRWHAGRGWLVYEGGCWQPDAEAMARQMVEHATMQIPDEITDDMDDAARGKVMKWAIRSLSASALNATLTILRTQQEILLRDQDPFDRNPWLLNCRNGTLDLRTGRLREHRASDLCIKQAPVDYDPGAQCPRWLRFVSEIFNDRDSLITYMHRALGYALTGDTTEQAVFILWGRGSNGKSTLLEMVLEAMGGYGTAMNFSTLIAAGPVRQGANEDVARLAGIRFAKAVEAGADHRFNEPLLKELTGGDHIAARFLFKNTFTFTPQFKLFLGVNDRPKIAGTDEGIWRRVRLVPFTAEFSNAPERLARGAKPKDEALKDKLRQELPGILAWMVQGCLAWQEGGLAMPPEVQGATESYRAENDTVTGFLAERCILEEAADVTQQELYDAYSAWCEARDGEALTTAQFSRRLTSAGFRRTRSGSISRRKGLRLRDSVDDIIDRDDDPTARSNSAPAEGGLPDQPDF